MRKKKWRRMGAGLFAVGFHANAPAQQSLGHMADRVCPEPQTPLRARKPSISHHESADQTSLHEVRWALCKFGGAPSAPCTRPQRLCLPAVNFHLPYEN